jgi:acyl carrier protein
MERFELLKQLETIFKEVMENQDIKLSELTTADDLSEWDSLTHIQLVVTLERHYSIRFLTSEIQSWNNVGDMMNSISSKLK